MISETELYLRCKAFIEEQSGGEWGEKVEREDTRKLMEFVREIAALGGTDAA